MDSHHPRYYSRSRSRSRYGHSLKLLGLVNVYGITLPVAWSVTRILLGGGGTGGVTPGVDTSVVALAGPTSNDDAPVLFLALTQ